MPSFGPREPTASMERHRPERPAPHPQPPDDLASRSLLIVETDTLWIRMHRCRHVALYFGGSGENRFDAPNGEYAILYAGADPYCAFIETFGDVTASPGRAAVTWQALEERCLTRIEPSRPLRLVDLTGAGLARIGADARLTTGPHDIARHWALALWQDYPHLDGIYYRARHDPERSSVALFEDRVAQVLQSHSAEQLTAVGAGALVADLLDHYAIALLASGQMP